MIVDTKIKDQILDLIIKETENMQPGDPLDPETFMGAMVDHDHTQTVMNYIETGKDEANLVTGGEQSAVFEEGCYIQPTIFDQVENNHVIAQEEIFGPVLSVITVDGAEEAIRVANDSIYGLAAGIWSDDVSTLHKSARALKAGVVYANCFDADDITTPFGGYKQSGIGRDKSLHALDKYTEIKATWLKLND